MGFVRFIFALISGLIFLGALIKYGNSMYSISAFLIWAFAMYTLLRKSNMTSKEVFGALAHPDTQYLVDEIRDLKKEIKNLKS